MLARRTALIVPAQKSMVATTDHSLVAWPHGQGPRVTVVLCGRSLVLAQIASCIPQIPQAYVSQVPSSCNKDSCECILTHTCDHIYMFPFNPLFLSLSLPSSPSPVSSLPSLSPSLPLPLPLSVLHHSAGCTYVLSDAHTLTHAKTSQP
jgi:hypothetical protein